MGGFVRLAVIATPLFAPATSAFGWDRHKQKVLVPLSPVYAMPTSLVAQAPVVTYSAAPVAAAPVGLAPTPSVVNGIYYAPTGAAPVGLAPTATVYTTGYAPQNYTTTTGLAPTGSSFVGTVPPRIGDSRMTDDGRKDILDDLRDNYRETKSGQSSRTALRKALKDQAREKYVEVIGDDVQSPDDLRDSENKEIDQIVDIVMREDTTNSANSGNSTQYTYGNGYAGQPTYLYYVYPVAPAGHPLLHRK